MSNEPILFRSAELKQHGRELDRLERKEEKAAAELGTIARTTERAMLAGLAVTKTRNAAEQLAPDAAEKLALMDLASTGAMLGVIQRVVR